MLEAFLQITSQTVPARFNARTFPSYDNVFRQAVGAVYSEHFFFGGLSTRSRLADALNSARVAAARSVGAELTWDAALPSRDWDQATKWVEPIDSLQVDPAKVLEWQGWLCRKKGSSQRLTYLPLTPVRERLGEAFAVELHRLASVHVSTRRGEQIIAVRALANYIASADNRVSIETLRDPGGSEGFFCDLYRHYLQAGFRDGEGSAVARLVRHWRGQITSFFEDVVFPSGLIARPTGGMPLPRPLALDTQTKLTRTDKGLVHIKLLTPVPLEVSDDEAITLIFQRIEEDIEHVKRWAWTEVNRLAELLARRKLLANEGVARRIQPYGSNSPSVGSTDWKHPDHLKNAAATFEELGYPNFHGRKGSTRDSTELYPSSKIRWAEELAIPTANSLIAHCAVIISEHPAVTPAFLEQFKLFDSNGKLAGISVGDGTIVATGVKLRKGPHLAHQDIILNERSAFAFDQICKLTEPLRAHLRKLNDPSWKFLLLTSGKAFGYPRRIRSLTSRTSNPNAVNSLTSSFQRALGLTTEVSAQLVERFSLSALRASAGVMVYFKTKSVHEMATALGHTKYRTNLLDRYLPKVLRQFFEERWIRIFQTGLIVQALEGSEYQREASGFESAAQLDQFLKNHSLQLPHREDANKSEPLPLRREAVFALNEEILITLVSLGKAQETGRPMLPLAMYWAELGREIVAYVEAAGNRRPDIEEYLSKARTSASATLVSHLAYA